MNETQLNQALIYMSQQRNMALDEIIKLQVQIAELRDELEKLKAAEQK